MFFKAIQESGSKREIWLKDDSSYVIGVFRGEIHDFKIHWIEKKKQKCTGTDCQICASGIKKNFRFRINFVHKGMDSFESSIYENDWFTYKRLSHFNDEFLLEENVIKIYRGMEGNYKVDLFSFERTLDSETSKIISQVPLLNLTETQNDRDDHGSDQVDDFNENYIPF